MPQAHLSTLRTAHEMTHREHWLHFPTWIVPLLYAVAAIVAGLTFPRIEYYFLPGLVSGISAPAAMAMYSAIASGMIALTGIVFSLAFVMVQFSSTAYSPRLVLWIARDPFMKHALGIFTATFLYAIAALAWVGRNESSRVPFLSSGLVVVLLMASVGMFVGLIQRIGLLQVNYVLNFTGDQGRKVIAATYQPDKLATQVTGADGFRSLPRTQTLLHHGRPQFTQRVNSAAFVNLAKSSGGVIEMVGAVGECVLESTPVLHVFGARHPIDEQKLIDGIEMGAERTFEQDPAYAIRLLVDIAIKALSPAVNDPTTAVQALDQIEDLLLRLGQCNLEIGSFADSEGKVRLVVPFPTWDDFLRLAFDEIRCYGAASVQVMRRMNALVSDLIQAVPEKRRAPLKHWDKRLQATIAHSFTEDEERMEASQEDRQGLGVPRKHFSEVP